MWRVFWGLLLCCVLAGCTSTSRTESWAREQLMELEMASHLWQTKNVQHYQMDVFQGECEQQIEVNGDITIVMRDTCSHYLQFDMPYIFNLIEERIEWYRLYPRCGPNGCECDGPVNIDVEYDPKFGYPRAVKERPFAEYRTQPALQDGEGESDCGEQEYKGLELKVFYVKPL
jgi:hypothetical protein